jgi:hypothetical protein
MFPSSRRFLSREPSCHKPASNLLHHGLLAGTVATNALAAGHGMGGQFGGPLIGGAPMTSLIFNPPPPYTVPQSGRNLRAAIEKVSTQLGNTPTICRKCYVHPEVLNSYMDGNLVLELKSKGESALRSGMESFEPQEAAVLALLRSRLAKEAKGSRRQRARAG